MRGDSFTIKINKEGRMEDPTQSRLAAIVAMRRSIKKVLDKGKEKDKEGAEAVAKKQSHEGGGSGETAKSLLDHAFHFVKKKKANKAPGLAGQLDDLLETSKRPVRRERPAVVAESAMHSRHFRRGSVSAGKVKGIMVMRKFQAVPSQSHPTSARHEYTDDIDPSLAPTAEKLKRIFKMIDVDGVGAVEQSSVTKLFTLFHLTLKDEETKALLHAMAGPDPSSSIHESNFVLALLNQSDPPLNSTGSSFPSICSTLLQRAEFILRASDPPPEPDHAPLLSPNFERTHSAAGPSSSGGPANVGSEADEAQGPLVTGLEGRAESFQCSAESLAAAAHIRRSKPRRPELSSPDRVSQPPDVLVGGVFAPVGGGSDLRRRSSAGGGGFSRAVSASGWDRDEREEVGLGETIEVASVEEADKRKDVEYWMTYACHLRDKTALKKAKEKEKADEEADGASRDKYKAKLRVFEAMTKSEFISTPEILELKALKEASLASKSALAGVGVGEEGEETAGKKGEGASTGSSGSSGLTASGSASRDGSRAGTGPGGLARLDAAALAKVHVTIDTALLGTDMPERRFSVAGPVILSNLNPAARAVIAAASAPVNLKPGPGAVGCQKPASASAHLRSAPNLGHVPGLRCHRGRTASEVAARRSRPATAAATANLNAGEDQPPGSPSQSRPGSRSGIPGPRDAETADGRWRKGSPYRLAHTPEWPRDRYRRPNSVPWAPAIVRDSMCSRDSITGTLQRPATSLGLPGPLSGARPGPFSGSGGGSNLNLKVMDGGDHDGALLSLSSLSTPISFPLHREPPRRTQSSHADQSTSGWTLHDGLQPQGARRFDAEGAPHWQSAGQPEARRPVSQGGARGVAGPVNLNLNLNLKAAARVKVKGAGRVDPRVAYEDPRDKERSLAVIAMANSHWPGLPPPDTALSKLAAVQARNQATMQRVLSSEWTHLGTLSQAAQ